MRIRLSRLPAAFVVSLVALWLTVPAVLAAYPPGPFPGPAPAGAFPTVLMSRTVCTTADTLVVADGASNVRLEVPAGAFAECTQLTIYAVDESIVKNLLPDGYSVIDALAIGWSPDATPTVALALTVTDAAIASDSTGFQTTMGGVSSSSDITVSSGHASASFSHAIGIVVAGQQEVEGATGQPSPLPSTDLGESSGSPELILTFAVVVLGGAAFVGLVIARRPRQR